MAGKSAASGLGTVYHVSVDDQGMRQTLKGLRSSIRSTAAEWKSQFAILRSSGQYLEAAKAKYEGLSKAIKQQESLINRYKSELSGMGKRTSENAESYDKLSRNLSNAERKLSSLSAQQERAKKLADYEATGIRKIKDEMSLATKEITASVHAYQSQGKTYEANKAKVEGLKKQIASLTSIQTKERELLSKIESESGKDSSAYRNQAVRITELSTKLREMTRQEQQARQAADQEASGIDKIKAAMALEAKEVSANVRALRSQGKTYEADKAQIEGLKGHLRSLTDIQAKEREQLAKIKSESGSGSEAYRKQAIKVTELGTKIRETTGKAKNLEQTLSKRTQLHLSLGDVQSKLGKVKDTAEKTQHIFGKMFGAGVLSNAVSSAWASVTSSIHEAFHAGLDYEKEQQVMQASWNTLAGSAKKGKALVDMVNQISVKTGQSVDTINEMAQGFYHLNSSQKEARAMTNALANMADTVGLNGEQIKEVTNDMVHGLSAGKLQLGTLNQIDQYFPMFSEAMAKHLNVSKATMRKMVSAGKVSAKEVETVFEHLGNVKYEKASENMLTTLTGMSRVIHARVPALIGAFETPFQKAQAKAFGQMSKWVSSKRTESEFNKMGQAASKGVTTIINAFAKVYGHGSVTDTADAAVNGITKGITRLSNYIASHAKDIVGFFKSTKETMKTLWSVAVPTLKDILTVTKPIFSLIAKHPKGFAQIAADVYLGNKALGLFNFAFGRTITGFGHLRNGYSVIRNITKGFKTQDVSISKTGALLSHLKDGLGRIGTDFGRAVAKVVGKTKDLTKAVGSKAFHWTAKVTTSGARKSLSGLKKAGSGLKNVFKWTAHLMTTAAKKGLSGLKSAGRGIGKVVRWTAKLTVTGAKKALSGLKKAGRGIGKVLRWTAKVSVSAAKRAISSIGSAAKSAGKWIGKIGSNIKSIGKKAVTKSISAISSGLKSMGRYAKSAASYAGTLSKRLLTKAKAVAVAAGEKIVAGATKAWTVAQRALNVVLRANPIGLVITAIAALAAGLAALYKHNKRFRNFVNGIWSGIHKTFGHMVSWVKGRWGSLSKSTSNLRKSVSSHFSGMRKSVGSHIGKMMSSAKSAFHNGYSALNKITGGKLDDMVHSVSKHTGKIVDYFKKLPGRMGRGIKNGWHAVANAGIYVGNHLLKGIQKVVDGVEHAINWVLKKVGMGKHRLSDWHAPRIGYYAKGTVDSYGRFLKDQLAVVGDGYKHELIKHANGLIEMTPNKPTLTVVRKGDSILGGDKTETLMSAIRQQRYGIGTWIGKATDFIKGGFSKLTKGADAVWDALSHPVKLLNTLVDHFTKSIGLNGVFGTIGTGIAKTLINASKKFISDLFGDVGNPGGKGVKRWIPVIHKAATMSHVSLSGAKLKAILKRIAQESNGSPTVTNHWDINARLGHPSTGLLQYIEPTFLHYARAGHKNIHSGFDQLLALFNDSNWYRDIAHAGGWGPTGHKRFANGGLVTRHTFAELSEGNQPEAVIPLSLSKKNRAVQLLAQVMSYMSDKDNTDNDQQASSNLANNNSVVVSLLKQNNDLTAQNNQLMQLLIQTVEDKPTITDQQVYQAWKKQNRQQTLKSNRIKGVFA
jgi:tape measure domain-containing protein